jgi:hypothetical protein
MSEFFLGTENMGSRQNNSGRKLTSTPTISEVNK